MGRFESVLGIWSKPLCLPPFLPSPTWPRMHSCCAPSSQVSWRVYIRIALQQHPSPAFLSAAQPPLQHAQVASQLAVRRGRMRMQVMGFLLVAAAFLACAAGYDALVQPGGIPAFQVSPAQLHAVNPKP